MMRRLSELWEYRDFWKHLVYQQALARYQGSLLGFLWTLVFPLLTFLTFTLVFSVLNNQSFSGYGLYFLSGYIPWIFLANTATLSCDAVVGSPVYVTRVRVPRALLPLAVVALQAVDLAAGLVLLALFMAVFSVGFHPCLVAVLFSLIPLTAAATGIALYCSAMNVVFRDFRHLLSAFLFLWFFVSPILWRPDGNASLQPLVRLNPVVYVLKLFQQPIAYRQWPDFTLFLAVTGISIVVLLMGLQFFFSREKEFYCHV